VATPVWFVIENGRLLVKTNAQSFKVKRVRRNSTVMIAPGSASGRLRGAPMPAQAELLPQSDIDHVEQLIARKYPVDEVLILPLYRVVQRLRGTRAETTRVALEITHPSRAQPEHLGGFAMKIEYLHASKYGNGATVAAEFKKQMAANGLMVAVHHIREVTPTALSPADLYVFSSPGRIGKPIGGMRRFLKKLKLATGTRYAILTTEAAPSAQSRPYRERPRVLGALNPPRATSRERRTTELRPAALSALASRTSSAGLIGRCGGELLGALFDPAEHLALHQQRAGLHRQRADARG
jgi:PPOX class probable F420-dependent enzyme